MEGRSKQGQDELPFFVYGTLLPDQPNAFLWQGLQTGVENARFGYGRLHDMGGYPMLVETGEHYVKGKLITVVPDFHLVVLSRLDLLEGYDPLQPDLTGYRRVVREVKLESGRSTSAWIYVGQIELVNGRALVPNGDWAAYVRQQTEEYRPSSTTQHPVTGPIF